MKIMQEEKIKRLILASLKQLDVLSDMVSYNAAHYHTYNTEADQFIVTYSRPEYRHKLTKWYRQFMELGGIEVLQIEDNTQNLMITNIAGVESDDISKSMFNHRLPVIKEPGENAYEAIKYDILAVNGKTRTSSGKNMELIQGYELYRFDADAMYKRDPVFRVVYDSIYTQIKHEALGGVVTNLEQLVIEGAMLARAIASSARFISCAFINAMSLNPKHSNDSEEEFQAFLEEHFMTIFHIIKNFVDDVMGDNSIGPADWRIHTEIIDKNMIANLIMELTFKPSLGEYSYSKLDDISDLLSEIRNFKYEYVIGIPHVCSWLCNPMEVDPSEFDI